MMDPYRDDPLDEDEQPSAAAGIGVGAYVGRTEERDADNDQGSHVSPSDNDGETVPSDEVVDRVGG
jgi:hypothetical protein